MDQAAPVIPKLHDARVLPTNLLVNRRVSWAISAMSCRRPKSANSRSLASSILPQFDNESAQTAHVFPMRFSVFFAQL